MRAVFFGTPAIAVPSLEALRDVAEVVGVICQPDRPQGRGLRLQEPPVKQRALELGLEVYQPLKVKTGELERWLTEREVDVGLVIAYGRILPLGVLAAPRLGCLNLHASLLPQLRGAAPIQWALIRGDSETGISLMQMDEGCDTGPVFLYERLAIDPLENAGALTERLGTLAAHVTRTYVPEVVSGRLRGIPQLHSRATHAPLITSQLCHLDFKKSPLEVTNLVRGLAPRPGAFTLVAGKRFKILACSPVMLVEPFAPGAVVVRGRDQVLIGCGDGGAVEVRLGQFEGRAALGPADLIQGRGVTTGMKCE